MSNFVMNTVPTDGLAPLRRGWNICRHNAVQAGILFVNGIDIWWTAFANALESTFAQYGTNKMTLYHQEQLIAYMNSYYEVSVRLQMFGRIDINV